jgi:catechol 2,3-dioxygenase-like lactoylglutathione lyase family enzyme
MPAAVHSLDHFALWVPDAAVGAEFYRDFGLTPTEAHSTVRLEAANGLAGYLHEGPRKRLHHVTFSASIRMRRRSLERASKPKASR